MGGQKFGVVICDMGCAFTGNGSANAAIVNQQCIDIIGLCQNRLCTGGFLVMKYLQGDVEEEVLILGKRFFGAVKRFKPEASRRDSRESYFVMIDKKAG
jgi:23S rRNA (uridine2552-2'-O)-methyltransferase